MSLLHRWLRYACCHLRVACPWQTFFVLVSSAITDSAHRVSLDLHGTPAERGSSVLLCAARAPIESSIAFVALSDDIHVHSYTEPAHPPVGVIHHLVFPGILPKIKMA